tara:strand:- start:1991 stop:2326 length:336 start_codon:yes stop_codon:yes gene_type:complete
MSKDKDDKDPKDNVIQFPEQTPPDPSKVLLFTGKNIDDINEFNIEEMEIVDSFTPEELHKKMEHLDMLYEKCFHMTKHIELMMHEASTELDSHRLTALEADLRQIFIKFTK